MINNFNYGRYVGAAIESALRQTYTNCEVIIVDDGSTDDSREVIAGFGGRITVVAKENGGQASAFNAGIARASGDFILLLDSDDYLYPDAVAQCVAHFPEHYSRIYYRLDAIDAQGERLPDFDRKIPFVEFDGDAHVAAAAGGQFPATVTTANFFRAAALKAIVPIPEARWRICADNFVAIQASTVGPVRSMTQVLGAYRFHGKNAWMAQDCLYIDRKRLTAYLDSHLKGRILIADNCRTLGIAFHERPLGDDFWLLHLLTAARRMNVDLGPDSIPNRSRLVQAILRYVAVGDDFLPKRIVNACYLLAILAPTGRMAEPLIRTYTSLMGKRAARASA